MSNVFTAVVRLVADPEKKQIKDDLSLVTFRAANNLKGKKEEQTLWIRCSVWGKLQDIAMNYLKKGNLVMVSGELSQQEWEKDGAKNSSLELAVDKIVLIDGKKKDEEPAPAKQTPTKQTTKPTTKATKPQPANDHDIPF